MESLYDFLAQVQARKAALGWTDTPERTEALRNKGHNRTPEKRELLRACAERARAAGADPVPAHF